MKKLLKKSISAAFAFTTTAVFTFVPEDAFGILKWFNPGGDGALLFGLEAQSVNIFINRMLFLLGVWCLCLIGYQIYRKRRNKVTIEGYNYKISIEYGDLLTQEGCKRVIAFDECFTTTIGPRPEDIRASSICGQYLAANPDLKDSMGDLIASAGLTPLSHRRFSYGDRPCYEPGRIVLNGDDLLLAFAVLDQNGRARLSREQYIRTLELMWKEIHMYSEGKDVCIPILGAGVAEVGEGESGASLSGQELLDIIILSYKLSPYKIKLQNKLRILLRKDSGISLDQIDGQG